MIKKLSRIPRYFNHYLQSYADWSLEAAYGLPNPAVRALALKPVYPVAARIKRLGMPNIGRALIMDGISISGGCPLRVGLVGQWETGERNSLPLYRHHLYGENETDSIDLGNVAVRDFSTKAAEIAEDVDLVLLLGHTSAVRPPTYGEWALGPDGVRMVFEFRRGETWDDVKRRMREQNENMRRMRRGGYRCRISQSDEEFQFFYHHMYLPTVSLRFQQYGDISREDRLQKEFQKRGMIIFVEDPEGNICAGGLKISSRSVLYGLVSGVVMGSRENVRRGALAALYYYSIRHAFQNGFNRYDAGNNEAFLTDGVYVHKRLWGCEPQPDYWRPRSLLCWTANRSESALAWLKAHPFVQRYARWGGEVMSKLYTNL